MFERDNTPIWLGGLVAVAAFALIASYSQIRTAEHTDTAGLAASAPHQDSGPLLTRDQIQELTKITPAAGGR